MAFLIIFSVFTISLLYALTSYIVRVDPYCSTLSRVLKPYYTTVIYYLSTLSTALHIARPSTAASSTGYGP